MSFFTNNSVKKSDSTTGEDIELISQVIEQEKKENIKKERERFWNLFGFIPDRYVKYFNIIFIEISITLFFAIIYYTLLQDFDKHFFVPSGYTKEHFASYKFLTALFMSINFQTTTAYVDIKCRSIFCRFMINLQLTTTIAILFFFIST